ncbi:MAG TPA: hypothetical protein VEJ84_00900 [Acidimicrobiales bacterium]|nr:hypothetical protein [Acidimicrobiales bacterium]
MLSNDRDLLQIAFFVGHEADANSRLLRIRSASVARCNTPSCLLSFHATQASAAVAAANHNGISALVPAARA